MESREYNTVMGVQQSHGKQDKLTDEDIKLLFSFPLEEIDRNRFVPYALSSYSILSSG